MRITPPSHAPHAEALGSLEDINVIRGVFQAEIVAKVREEVRRGCRQVCIHAHPGAGKSYIGIEIAKGAMARRRSYYYVAPRINLVNDIHQKFTTAGIWSGIIMSDCHRTPLASVQLCCLPSLLNTVENAAIKPRIDVLNIDESHVEQDSVARLVEHYPQAVIVTMTGTPLPGMDRYVQSVVEGPSMDFLIRHGLLCPVRYVVPDEKRRPASLSGKLCAHLLGHPVEMWKKHAEGRPTVVFAASLAKSAEMVALFREAGITAETMEANTPTEGQGGRKDLFQRLRDGRLAVLSTVGTVSYGVDIPEIACIILAYTTEQDITDEPERLADYVQKVSRGIRPHASKKDLVVIDLCGLVEKFGHIGQEHKWPIESTGGKEKLAEEMARVAQTTVTCKSCGASFDKTYAECPNCHEPVKRRKAPGLKFVDVTLKVLNPDGTLLKTTPTPKDLRLFYEACVVIARQRGWKWPEYSGKHLFNERYKGYSVPHLKIVSGGEPSQELLSLADAYRKKKARAWFAKQRGIERSQRRREASAP